LTFDEPPARVVETIRAAELSDWIAPTLDAIGASVDRLLARAGVAASEVDRVFMTGGTSLVPAVREAFAARFGRDQLATGDELTSIALGLARRGFH
jgi:hypothetical chaperone protein